MEMHSFCSWHVAISPSTGSGRSGMEQFAPVHPAKHLHSPFKSQRPWLLHVSTIEHWLQEFPYSLSGQISHSLALRLDREENNFECASCVSTSVQQSTASKL
eukprot:2249313-Rhodomonas_salina.2